MSNLLMEAEEHQRFSLIWLFSSHHPLLCQLHPVPGSSRAPVGQCNFLLVPLEHSCAPVLLLSFPQIVLHMLLCWMLDTAVQQWAREEKWKMSVHVNLFHFLVCKTNFITVFISIRVGYCRKKCPSQARFPTILFWKETNYLKWILIW